MKNPAAKLKDIPVRFGVDPLEHLGEDLAHVHEVEDVDGDPETGVDHDPDLAPLGTRHHVTVADHGDDAATIEACVVYQLCFLLYLKCF